MKQTTLFTHLFVDIGGVLLSNGWDHLCRKRAVKYFKLDWNAVEDKHRLIYETYESGNFSLEDYLNFVIFYETRPFSHDDFKNFMFSQSKAYPEMIELIIALKAKYGLKIVVVSNEAKELNAYRIQTFNLNRFVDTFVSSCFVHIRKPDRRIFRLALDIGMAKPNQILYIENTPMFVQIAEEMGIRGIIHKDYPSTREKLEQLGLHIENGTSS